MKKIFLTILLFLFSINIASAALTPIARFDVVPHQRISQGETFNVGVVAFSAGGIDRVEFEIFGQGYSGGIKTATEMTYNPRTDVYEYWVPVSASEFSTNGPITIEATVYGQDGGIRTKDTDGDGVNDDLGLDPIELVVVPNDPTGTQYERAEAWVDATTGDDDTGEVNNPDQPFLTVSRAIGAINNWRSSNGYGENVDGGIVRLNPGTHTITNARMWGADFQADEYITITTTDGGTKENTILQSDSEGGGGIALTRMIHTKGITLQVTEGYPLFNMGSVGRSRATVWIDDCNLYGHDRWVFGSNVLLSDYNRTYYTDSFTNNSYTAINTGWDMRTRLIRNHTATFIGSDVLTNAPLAINVHATELWPTSNGERCDSPTIDGGECFHQDCWQLAGSSMDGDVGDNFIAYNFYCEYVYQGMMTRGIIGNENMCIDGDPPSGLAFVNVDFVKVAPEGAGGSNLYMTEYDHEVFLHNSFRGGSFAMYDDGHCGGQSHPSDHTNSMFVGNFFTDYKHRGDGVVDYTLWSDNHYDTGSEDVEGVGASVGDPMFDAQGKPMEGSPLINRLTSSVIPGDYFGNQRDSSPDIGPYEYMSEEPVCGNNIIETGEVCDGNNLNGESCSSQGYTQGTLSCLSDCSGYDLSACTDVQNSSALTPIARFDVVPFQRIHHGETFNVGVVAFHKEGIARVDFSISGQGYSGGIKTATEMTYNPRTSVWEYWVPVSSSEFTSDGPITIEATVYGNDGGIRNKNWLIDNTFGATYDIECTQAQNDLDCSITSDGLFSPDMRFARVFLFSEGENYWEGIHFEISEASSDTLRFTHNTPSLMFDGDNLKFGDGDRFIISKGFGLDPLVLNVDATGSLAQPEAWVQNGASGGQIGDSNSPFGSVPDAINAIQSVNGGKSDGGIVYLEEGEYLLGDALVSTTDEWLTITKSAGAAKENVIVHDGGDPYHEVTTTDLLRMYDVTIRNDQQGVSFLSHWRGGHPTWLWVDTSRVVGSGRWPDGQGTSPISRSDDWFITDSYITNLDIAMRFADIVRNVDIEAIGDDASFLCDMVINLKVHNQDPNRNEDDATPTYGHADGWQWAGHGMENIIVYGYHGTDMHVQGIFARMYPDGGVHKNFAFVNVLLEMRLPRRPGREGDTNTDRFGTVSFYGPMDHMIFWHTTIPVQEAFAIFNERGIADFKMTNSSFIGNMFHEYANYPTADTDPLDYGLPGNFENNVFLHNHYVRSRVDSVGDTGGERTKSPDTDPSGSQSLGDPDIIMTLDSPDYGMPNPTSPLVDRLSKPVVPIDIFGNLRDSSPDVGAIEYLGQLSTCSGTCCSEGQQCSGGTFSSSSDCGSLCCVGGTCEDPTCSATDTSCGIYPNCENCNNLDACYSGERRDYYCVDNSNGCDYNVVTVDETILNNNCFDSIDNDCDGLIDGDDPGCTCLLIDNTEWRNIAIDPLTDDFTIISEVTPQDSSIDGVLGVSSGETTSWSGFTTTVRFNVDGNIDVWDPSTVWYGADVAVSYTAGATYKVRTVLNFSSSTYDVYITPVGESEIMIADDYQFRNPDAMIDYWTVYSDIGSMTVCNTTILTKIHDADTDSSGVIELDELNKYIQLWLKTSTISLPQLIEVVELWKNS